MTRPHELDAGVAVVTGGASGIGRAIAAQLIGRGMTVVIADVEQAKLDATAAALGAIGVHADVTDAASMQALADMAGRRFGGVRLFCSNAGVGSTAAIADMRVSDWRWLLDVNLFGLIHGVQAFLPLLRASAGGGHLAVTASMAGLHVTPGLGGYTVSKFAALALGETLAAELDAEGSEVGVTLLCPGPVSTDLGSSQRNRADVGGLIDRDLEKSGDGAGLRWMSPDDVAQILLRAIERGDLYAFTHPEWAPLVAERHRHIADALAATTTP